MNKKIVGFIALFLIFSTLAYSAPRSSSRSSSSRSSSSRSSSSRPSSRPASPSTKPSSRPSTRPSTPSSNSSVKPTQPSVRPPSSNNQKPIIKPSTSNSSSSKPTGSTFDAASTAQKQQESKSIFQASKPKPPAIETSKPPVAEKPVSYTSKSGKSYQVDKNATSAKTIQSTVSPQEHAQRTTRVEHHYHNNYGNRYDYYRSQPYIDVGGGYSALFWYAMMDWSLERRAMWLYNNQHTINSSLYNEQLKNEALRLEIEKLKAKNAQVDPNYVDSEFKENPDLMYSDEYVNAVVKPQASFSFTVVLIWIVIIVCLVSGVYLIFFKDWKIKGY